MKTTWRLLALTAVLAVVVRALAEQPALEDPQAVLEQNRRLLEKWRADPDHYARLQRDKKAFQELSSERQERLRRFDHDLHEEDAATQARLWAVLERYVAWLDKLPADHRKWIEAARNSGERLERVKYIRDQQWVARLPKKVQDELNALPEEKRPERIAEERQKERARRLEWFWASHPRDLQSLTRARPTRMAEFPPEVRFYWFAALSHTLLKDKKERLQEAEGNWPLYARTLAEVMVKPPPELPGFFDNKAWPTNFQELPQDWKRTLLPYRQKGPDWKALQAKLGKWPDYAIAVTHFARTKQLKIESQLGPAKLEQYPPWVQNFLKAELMPKLTQAEKTDLSGKEGKWPEYPQALLEKAKRHSVTIPGTVRPEPKEFFDAMSKLLPDVPNRTLRNFALTELTAEERNAMKLSPDDESSRERLIAKYWERHPDQLASQMRPHGRKPKRP
jgi:hypothetical protein